MTNIKDALFAAKLGVDAIGMIFVPNTPRFITIPQAKLITDNLPPWITTVAVVVNADQKTIFKILNELPIDLIQFHGEETPDFCEQFNKPFVKTIHMQQQVDLQSAALRYHKAKTLLLDTYVKDIPGGTGETFNWSLISKINMPIILSGGLNPTNVAESINTVKPYGIDVCSGIEKSPGKKDQEKMQQFINEVKQEC